LPAWIRFSNGIPLPKEDRIGDVRGMAIKLVGVPGPKLLPDERDAVTQDFVLADFPRFFLRDALEYVPFTTLARRAGRTPSSRTSPTARRSSTRWKGDASITCSRRAISA
jgi:catalase